MSVLALAAVLLLFPAAPVSAQRTVDRSFFADASAGMTVSRLPSGSAELEFGQYLLGSYWKVSLKMSDWIHPVGDGSGVCYDHIAWRAGGGFMYRVFATRDRAWSVYLGGQAYVGFNQHEAFRRLPDYYELSLAPLAFICGVEPEAEVEYFCTDRLAVLFGCQCPVTFISDLREDMVRFTWTVGVRYNF